VAVRTRCVEQVEADADTTDDTLAGPRTGAFSERLADAAAERVEAVTTELEAAGVETVGSVVRCEPLEAIENAIDDGASEAASDRDAGGASGGR